MFFFRGYTYENGKYNFALTIPETNSIEYTFVQNDYPNYDQLEMRLKNLPEYLVGVPRTENQLNNIKPLIITKEDGTGRLIWFSFIISREFQEERGERTLFLKGAGFTFFENTKIILSNKDNPLVTDPNALPSNFAKYQRTTTLKNHLEYFYDSAFLNPLEPTYGPLATIPQDERKFKGLNSVTVDYTSAVTKNISLDQTSVFEAKKDVYESFEIELVTRQFFDKVNGLVDIEVSEAIELSSDIVRRNDDIIQRFYGVESTNNYVFSWGNPQNYNNQFALKADDFTTREITEDFSFVSGSNSTYLENTTKTKLRELIRNRLVNFLNIAPSTAFTEINAGDLLRIEGVLYRLRQLEESNSIGGINFNVEIEEVE